MFSTARSASSVDVAHDDWHLCQAEGAGGGDPVEAGDELERVAVVAHDDGDENALELDRAGERLDVRIVERADVVGDADLVERDLAPDVWDGRGHVVLLWMVGPPRWRADPAATRTPARACHRGWRVGPSAGVVFAFAHRLVERQDVSQL